MTNGERQKIAQLCRQGSAGGTIPLTRSKRVRSLFLLHLFPGGFALFFSDPVETDESGSGKISQYSKNRPVKKSAHKESDDNIEPEIKEGIHHFAHTIGGGDIGKLFFQFRKTHGIKDQQTARITLDRIQDKNGCRIGYTGKKPRERLVRFEEKGSHQCRDRLKTDGQNKTDKQPDGNTAPHTFRRSLLMDDLKVKFPDLLFQIHFYNFPFSFRVKVSIFSVFSSLELDFFKKKSRLSQNRSD